jgi:hypothetical protein
MEKPAATNSRRGEPRSWGTWAGGCAHSPRAAQTKAKILKEPLIPVGCAVTAVILMGGFGSFIKGNPARSQQFMRARVAAQGFTLCALGYYAVTNSFLAR